MTPETWIAERLAAAGRVVLETKEIKRGETGYIWQVMTDQGAGYFKATTPTYAAEAPLTAALAQWYPSYLPQVFGSDAEARWLLIDDAGPTVKSLTLADGDYSRWDTMLRKFAKLQQASLAHCDELLALGAADRRLSVLPELYDQLIEDTEVLLVGKTDGVTGEQYAELRAFAPKVRALCKSFADSSIPETLHHDDFHVNNVGVKPGEDFRYFDWGECCIAHPFYSLMMSMRYAKLAMKADDAVMARMERAYLEGWVEYAPLDQLQAAYKTAAQLGALCRTLTWYHVVKTVEPEFRADMLDAVPYWMLTFLYNKPFELL